MRLVERRSYIWFEKRRRTKGLELAHEQITKAFDTVTLLHKAMQSFAEGNLKEANKHIENLFTAEEEVEKFTNNPAEAIAEAKKVEDIEHDLDQEYLNAKSLFVKYGEKLNCGAMVIFDDLIEFIEHAADMCADTADYIVVLSSRE